MLELDDVGSEESGNSDEEEVSGPGSSRNQDELSEDEPQDPYLRHCVRT